MREIETSASGQSAHLMVPIFIFSVLLSIAVIRGPAIISSAGIGSAVIVVAPLILATYALTIIVIAGRAGVDLSIGPLIGFLNVGLIQLFSAGLIESPVIFFLYAMGVGVAYQLVMGLIIVFVRVQPLIVALSGYLALVGLNLIILPRPGGVAPDWMLTWGSGTTIWSPVLVILVIATAAWYVLANTAFFTHLRLMGSDERAAYTSGVRINIVRLGAHCVAGIYAGLAAICFTSLISSGDPTQGTTFTLMAVTALVLGGANLAGGRGGALGSMFGALNIYLITYLLGTFNFGRFQSFVTDLSYGAILVLSLLISLAIPQIKLAARYLSPALFIAILASVAGGVIVHSTLDIAVPQQSAGIGGLSNEITAQAPAATGTIVMLVILGFAALIYLVSLLFRYPRAPAIALAIAVAVATLGLIFHGADTETLEAARNAGYSLEYLALERLDIAANPASGVVVYAAYGAILAVGIILLASLIIGLNLPWARLTARALPIVLLATGILAIVALKAGNTDGLFGTEALIVALAGMILFIFAFAPLQAMLTNISSIFIAGFCVLAVGFVYFAAQPKEPGNQGATVAVDASNSIFARRPAQNVQVSYPELRRLNAVEGTSSALSQWASSILVIGLLQFFLWQSMRGHALPQFWPFLHIVTGAAIAWGALFYSIGVSLWTIAAVATVAALTAPFIWRVFDFYLKGRPSAAVAQ